MRRFFDLRYLASDEHYSHQLKSTMMKDIRSVGDLTFHSFIAGALFFLKKISASF